ncbi:MAG: anaerobic ribonucleoside-triphosphate reductase activating protein [Muribaculaceae bacterium]|nr:anaerobic ribonucleoside-triphosphate reductase activating protein [Muribaculaceae bacterium]
MDTINIMRIVEGTSVDGPGLRTSIYFAGCRHRCPGCHNQQTWDFASGTPMTIDEVMKTVLYNEFNVTFSGGDPMYSAEAILPLAREIKKAGYTIWCYTGFTFEELLNGTEAMRELLKFVDVLVDGPFIEALRDTSLLFRGSSNQRLIDVPNTLSAGHIILFDN